MDLLAGFWEFKRVVQSKVWVTQFVVVTTLSSKSHWQLLPIDIISQLNSAMLVPVPFSLYRS